jgi:hypothetical protein
MGTSKLGQNWDDLRESLAVARTGTPSAATERLGTKHVSGTPCSVIYDELKTRLFRIGVP